jgi:hypothetical protein
MPPCPCQLAMDCPCWKPGERHPTERPRRLAIHLQVHPTFHGSHFHTYIYRNFLQYNPLPPKYTTGARDGMADAKRAPSQRLSSQSFPLSVCCPSHSPVRLDLSLSNIRPPQPELSTVPSTIRRLHAASLPAQPLLSLCLLSVCLWLPYGSTSGLAPTSMPSTASS